MCGSQGSSRRLHAKGRPFFVHTRGHPVVELGSPYRPEGCLGIDSEREEASFRHFDEEDGFGVRERGKGAQISVFEKLISVLHIIPILLSKVQEREGTLNGVQAEWSQIHHSPR